MRKTKKRLSISHLHWGFPPIIGGVETHLTIILPQMVNLGHRVSLLTGSVEGVEGRYKYNGVEVFRTPLMDLNWLYKRGLEGLEEEIYSVFANFIETTKPDIIHAHNVIAARLALESELPLIYDDHEYWSKEARHRIRDIADVYRWIKWSVWEKIILKKASAIITVSNEIAREHLKYNSRVFILPNLPMSREVHGLRKLKTRRKISIVYIGSISEPQPSYRNIHGFIRLILRNNIGDLIIIGDRKLKTCPPIYSIGFLEHYTLLKE